MLIVMCLKDCNKKERKKAKTKENDHWTDNLHNKSYVSYKISKITFTSNIYYNKNLFINKDSLIDL